MTPADITPRERRTVTAAILCGIFLVAMDILVVSTAMPAIVADFGDISFYPWAVAAYILASTTTVPLYGKLSDIHGRKPIYLFGVSLFMLGSLASGLAPSMGALIAARTVQGFGGGALLPVTLTIVGDLYPLKERARMQGVFSGVWGMASIVGPLVGGTLVDTAGWRWIFFINLPFGVLAGYLVHRHLREPAFVGKPHRVPYLGAAVLGAAVLTFLLGLLLPGMGHRWLSFEVILPLAVSPGLLALFLLIDSRAPEPILDRALFSTPIIRASNLASFFVSACLYGAAHYVPLFVQAVQKDVREFPERRATLSGFALTPMSVGWVLAAIVAGRLILRVGYRGVALTGLTIISLGAYLLTTLRPETPYPTLLLYMGITGVGLGLSVTSFIIAIQNSVPRERLGLATSSLQLFRMTGSVVGIAVLGAVLLSGLGPELQDPSEGLLAISELSGPSATSGEVWETTLATALRLAFLCALFFSAAALLAGLGIPGGKAELHLHEARRGEMRE